MLGIIGKKLGMGQIIQKNGDMTAVTFVLCEENEVVQIKKAAKDNADGIILGAFPLKKPRKNKKFYNLKQFSFDQENLQKGQKWNIKDLGEIKTLTITGISKGKGFQGGVKRHNFRTARKTHGTKEPRHGSTGACASPGRTKKGLKMAGHMGSEQVTLRGRKVVKVDEERNVIAIKGAVPGSIGSVLFLKKEEIKK